MDQDYFAFFGLDRRLNLDSAELQRRFYDLSRRYHPDRFARKSAAEQQSALDATALLNDAYRILRDPVHRAEYLLKREGLDGGEQQSKDVPPELLEEVFELNMALEEVREGDESCRPQLEQAQTKFTAMLVKNDAEIHQQFESYDLSHSRADLLTLRNALHRRRYIRNLITEVEKTLSPDH